MIVLRTAAMLTALTLFAGGWARAAGGSISGEVRDGYNQPLAAASVFLSGPQHATTQTDAAGVFHFEGLSNGTYEVTVSKGGYRSGGADGLTVSGTEVHVAVVLEAATLSTIRQIAHVSVSARETFNATEATQIFIGATRLREENQIQIGHLLDQIPGLVAARSGTGNSAVPGSTIAPNIRGALDYEKASLVDGHPLINGRLGDYPAQFLNSFVLDGIEITEGPGADAPQINDAIGGTINYLTAEPTRAPSGQALLGFDSFGGVFSNLRYSGTNGRLGFVVDYATNGTRGPLNSYASTVTLPAGTAIAGYGTLSGSTTSAAPINGVNGPYPVPNAKGNPSNAYATLVACCQSVSSDFINRADLLKVRYALSPATSITASYLGLQTQYDGTAAGFTQLFTTFAPAAGYSAAGGPQPGQQLLLNSTTQIPSRRIIDSEPILEAELRTAFHNDSILARFYGGALDRFTVNALADPAANYTTAPVTLFGTATVGGAARTFTGQQAALTIPTPYFQQVETDQMRGESFEYDHPVAANMLSFAVDRTTFLTYAYSITGSGTRLGGNVSTTIPAGSRQDFTTYLVRGIWEVGPQLEITLANYYNLYVNHFTPGQNPDGSFVFQTATRTHDDARAGLAYHPHAGLSLRFAAGSAVAPPFMQLLDGLSQTPAQVYTPGATSVTIVQNSGGLLPETSFGYDLGGDVHLRNGSILSGDLYLTNLRNQFVTTVTPNGTYTPPGSSSSVPVFVSTNVNGAQARFEGLEATLTSDPATGLGYVLGLALQRAYPYGFSSAFYSTAPGANTTNLGVVPGINYVGDNKPFFNGISNKSEAYAQGYGQLHWRGAHGRYAELAELYYGANNTYNIPAFFVTEFAYRTPLGNRLTLQLGADNLFGVDATRYLQYGAGVGAPLINSQLGLRSAIPYGPPSLRLTFSERLGNLGP